MANKLNYEINKILKSSFEDTKSAYELFTSTPVDNKSLTPVILAYVTNSVSKSYSAKAIYIASQTMNENQDFEKYFNLHNVFSNALIKYFSTQQEEPQNINKCYSFLLTHYNASSISN